MSADLLREAAALMRERADAARDVWGVGRWRPSLSELSDADGYRTVPAFMQTHVATDDVHGSVVLTSPWTDKAPTIHAASWHPAVALAVADWLDGVAASDCRATDMSQCDQCGPALTVARAYLAGQS